MPNATPYPSHPSTSKASSQDPPSPPQKTGSKFSKIFQCIQNLAFFSVHPNPPPNHPIPHPQPPQPSQPSPPPRPLPPVLGDSEAAPRLPLRDSTGRSTAAAPCGAGPGRGQCGPPAKPLRGKKKNGVHLGKTWKNWSWSYFMKKMWGLSRVFGNSIHIAVGKLWTWPPGFFASQV